MNPFRYERAIDAASAVASVAGRRTGPFWPVGRTSWI